MRPAARILALAAALLLPADPIPADVGYTLSLPPAAAGTVRITLDLPGLQPPRTFVMPRAIPMGYGEQPYDRFVSDLRAFDDEKVPLEVVREEGPRWRIEGSHALRQIVYEVDLRRMEREILSAADSSRSRPGYAGLLGYSIFGYVEGLEEDPVRLHVEGPPDWPVFSTLAPAAPPARGAVMARAADFYALADSQVAAGPDLRVRREEGTAPLYVALYAEGDVDVDRVARIGREALDAMIGYFGGAPFPHYTIHMEILKPQDADHVYGFSMEHLDSGTFFLGLEHALPRDAGEPRVRRAWYNLAHHIAHSWIPKRCHPEGYYPFTWELVPVLDSIWFSEGFAQYAAMVAQAERQEDPEAFRRALLDLRFGRRLEAAPAFIRRMSAVELSRVASTRYTQDFRTGSNCFSRGGMMAAGMDDRIRKETGGRKSLRDALRHLCAWSRREGRAFSLDELPGILAEGTGVDVRPIYERWLAPMETEAP